MADLEGTAYRAVMSFDGDTATVRVECGCCNFVGTASMLNPVQDCMLTPGDPSPAGRCPDCGSLAYVCKVSTYND